MKKIALSFVLIVIALGCKSVSACECGRNPSPGDAFAGANAVLIGVVTKVDPENSAVEDYQGEQIAYVKVERSFKTLDDVPEIVLHQPGHNCAPKYSPN